MWHCVNRSHVTNSSKSKHSVLPCWHILPVWQPLDCPHPPICHVSLFWTPSEQTTVPSKFHKWRASLPGRCLHSLSASVSLFPFEERLPESSQITPRDEVPRWHRPETLRNDYEAECKAWWEYQTPCALNRGRAEFVSSPDADRTWWRRQVKTSKGLPIKSAKAVHAKECSEARADPDERQSGNWMESWLT